MRVTSISIVDANGDLVGESFLPEKVIDVDVHPVALAAAVLEPYVR